MVTLIDHPLPFAFVVLLAFTLATSIGALLATRQGGLSSGQREDFNLVLGATMTLLSLIIGFSFSMAISRYDQRKSLEEAEANAIGTAYNRVELLGEQRAVEIKRLLQEYTRLRFSFYLAHDENGLKEVNMKTEGVQEALWAATAAGAKEQPTPLGALAAASVNDVINSQGYTQAAWWNRIPRGAWMLMLAIGFVASTMVGYSARMAWKEPVVMLMLPLVTSVAIFLIADIDSPRGGMIRLQPQNLTALSNSFHDLAVPAPPAGVR